MGAVSFSLDRKLLLALRAVLPVSLLVETGTFKGDTLAEFLVDFDVLHSVELSATLFREAEKRFAGEKHVHLHQGDSVRWLTENRPYLQGLSALYWLDAHWCASEGTAGEVSQCPLLEELGAIGHLNDDSVIVIDDARLFLAPPPPPHENSQWPRLWELIPKLTSLGNRHRYVVVNDSIVLYPERAEPAMQSYGRLHGVDWLEVSDHVRDGERLSRLLAESEADRAARLEVIQNLDAQNRSLRMHVARLEAIRGWWPCRVFRRAYLRLGLKPEGSSEG